MAVAAVHQQFSTTARKIIESQSVVTFFQPILSARQRTLVGAEALSRGVVGVEALSRALFGIGLSDDELISPAKLFGMAAQEGVTLELERLCRATAIRTFSQLQRSEDLILFLNFDARALQQDGNALENLLRQMDAANLKPRNVAVEILENAFEDAGRLRGLLDALRHYGFLLVLDDVGVGHSNLDRVPLIKPDVLKLDRCLVSGIENDYHRQETFKSLVHLARRIGALVVAEGVETEREAIIALELGADLLQGFFLGRPEMPGTLTCSDAASRIDALARKYKSHMIDRINDRKLQHRRFNIILNEILCELTKCPVEQFDQVLDATIKQYQNVECVYVLDESGTQVSSTVCNPAIPSRGNGVIFRPAPRGADHSLKEYYYVLLDVELHKYTTDPYVSLASGNLCRTISTCFRDSLNTKMYILCIDVLCE
ncbi:MAG TPA: EAL domain-containing protein [Tepidisphaeraceae bacterium]|nr:EAL domain-containing protein [Tepidisphaeraceae bacterium]